jgi:predicted house-cleaning NTP pyrophosphatase (Maf/HAM1 superfamily)
MILAGGSIQEFELLKRMSIHDFLIKFSNFAKEIEHRGKKPSDVR